MSGDSGILMSRKSWAHTKIQYNDINKSCVVFSLHTSIKFHISYGNQLKKLVSFVMDIDIFQISRNPFAFPTRPSPRLTRPHFHPSCDHFSSTYNDHAAIGCDIHRCSSDSVNVCAGSRTHLPKKGLIIRRHFWLSEYTLSAL